MQVQTQEQIRFVSFFDADENANCAMTEAEFHASEEAKLRATRDEWVWQFAASHEQAIAQHEEKFEAWERDPTKRTY